jgi:hypothetical protein
MPSPRFQFPLKTGKPVFYRFQGRFHPAHDFRKVPLVGFAFNQPGFKGPDMVGFQLGCFFVNFAADTVYIRLGSGHAGLKNTDCYAKRTD